MTAQLRVQLVRVGIVYLLLAALCTWQWHFIYIGLISNTYLNVMIIAVFVFGSSRVIIGMFKLRNEHRAVAALQEIWSDITDTRKNGVTDPLARHFRCFEPGTLYRRPHLLGHIFDFTQEELLRNKRMRISVSTMQNLVHAVDGRIALDRQLVIYLTGVCILLGLLGTFIGLMEMVGSVGAIIGGVAGEDATSPDAVKGLIRDLQVPLTAMATGFSASLFGLFGSLVLGLISRFASQATNAVRDEFEAWLAGISDMENANEIQPTGEGTGLRVVAGQIGGLAVALMGSFRHANQTFDAAAESIRRLAQRHGEQAEMLSDVCRHIESFSRHENDIRDALARTDATRAELSELRREVAQVAERVDTRLVEGFAGVGQRIEAHHGSHLAVLRQLAADQHAMGEQARQNTARLDESFTTLAASVEGARQELTDRIAAISNAQDVAVTKMREVETLAHLGNAHAAAAETWQERHGEALAALARREGDTATTVHSLTEQMARQPEAFAAAIRPALDAGLGEIARAMSETARTLGVGFTRLSEEQAELAASLDTSGPANVMVHELRGVARSIESGMADGFADLSRTMEAVLVSYSELARGNHRSPQPDIAPISFAPAEAPASPLDSVQSLARLRALAEKLRSGSPAARN
ncbi:hypothetical protein NK718_16840 [Alsobacter sp. SYSU M60028]|uniref:MotA/TolQ/ExbB proton channel domain-containing protein n=1 Tax=Alsobacter ponti TaxID=2962936 RepID=A0ABT1LFI9_9HYPH|nr:hypothetical protein [Alsobacter ponti]MCP8940194.1 hypothetical protein [Alsobacter ponti]